MSTHTYANVPVSPQTYLEIAQFFQNLGQDYDHVFIRRADNGQGDSKYAHLNMHGYALVVDPSKAKPDHAERLARAVAALIEHKPTGEISNQLFRAREEAFMALKAYKNRPKGE